jgi:hypothetical protein
MKMARIVEVMLHVFLISALDGGEWGWLYILISPSTHWIGGWNRPQTVWTLQETEKFVSHVKNLTHYLTDYTVTASFFCTVLNCYLAIILNSLRNVYKCGICFSSVSSVGWSTVLWSSRYTSVYFSFSLYSLFFMIFVQLSQKHMIYLDVSFLMFIFPYQQHQY